MKLLMPLFILLFFTFSLNASDKKNIMRGMTLEKINQFIDYKEIEDEFNICVYKSEELYESFEELYEDRTYKGHDVKVTYIDKIDEINTCHVLYAKKIKKKNIHKIINKLQKRLLFVTENVDYLEDGCMIALYFENKKIKFAINQSAIMNADLNVNYRLLKVATKVINPLGLK